MPFEMNIRALSDLPEEVRYFLVGIDGNGALVAAASAHGLPEDTILSLRKMAEFVVQNVYALADLPKIVRDSFVIDEPAAKEIAVAIAGTRLLPIQDIVVGNVAEAIRSWGGDPKTFSNIPRVTVATMTPEYQVKKLLEEAELEIGEPVMQRRLEYILLEFAKGAHDAAMTKEILARDAKVGGLELDEATASRVVDLFAERLAASGDSLRPEPAPEVAPEPKTAVSAAVQRPVAAVPPSIFEPKIIPSGPLPPPAPASEAPSVLPVSSPINVPPAPEPPASAPRLILPREPQRPEPKTDFVKDLFGEAEAQEVTAHAQSARTEAAPADLVGAVAQATERSGLVFDRREKRQRFESIAASRLRDVRSSYDTRAQLEKQFESGGLGLSGTTLVGAVQAIEGAFDAFQKTPAAKLDKEQQAARERFGQKKLEEEALVSREAGVLARRYAALTGRLSSEKNMPPSAPTAARTSAAETPAQSVGRQEDAIDKDKVALASAPAAPSAAANAPAPKLARPAPRYSAPTIVPAAAGKVEVRDVHFEKRLAGPVEELRRMALSDFRRLSADPKEAIVKIKDKLDMLEDEGYAKKIQGVKAWRESPVNQTYVALTREALTGGSSVADLIGRKRAAGEDVLTPEEMNAIVSLNAQLRF